MHGKNHLFKWMSGLPSGSQWGQQIFNIALETPSIIDIFHLPYSREQKHELLFRKSKILHFKVKFCEVSRNPKLQRC